MLCDAAFAHLRSADPTMGALIDRLGPYSIELDQERTHFESVMRSIIFQQLSGKAAATIAKRVWALVGAETATPASVLAVPEDALRGAGLSRQKTRYVRDLAERCASGEVQIERLHELPDDEITAELIKVAGVGRWTAQMFLIFRLGRPDVLPDLDLGIRKAIQQVYALPEMPTPQQVLEIGAPWRPHATTASLYLWRSIDEPAIAG